MSCLKIINGKECRRLNNGERRKFGDFLIRTCSGAWTQFAPEQGDARIQDRFSPYRAYRPTKQHSLRSDVREGM